jgi:hypothetical protein
MNKLNGRVISLETAMNEVGVKSPADEKDLIREERTDPTLFPEQAMLTTQAMQALAKGPEGDNEETKPEAGMAASQKQQAEAAPNKQVGTPGPSTVMGMISNATKGGISG